MSLQVAALTAVRLLFLVLAVWLLLEGCRVVGRNASALRPMCCLAWLQLAGQEFVGRSMG